MSLRRKRVVLALLSVAIGTSACSPVLTTPAGQVSTPSPSPLRTVGGMAECTKAALSDTAEGVISPDEQVGSIAGFGCDEGWAYALVTVEPANEEEAASPGAAFSMMMIFQAEGQFWIPRDPMDVCGTPPSVASPLVAPVDSQVPSFLWSAACWTN
jgi:hypothetical protein